MWVEGKNLGLYSCWMGKERKNKEGEEDNTIMLDNNYLRGKASSLDLKYEEGPNGQNTSHRRVYYNIENTLSNITGDIS